MTYEEIFSKAKKMIMNYDPNKTDVEHFALEIQIEGEGEGIFYAEIKDKQLYVEPYDYRDNDCRMILSGKNFLDILSGKLDPVKAFTVGDLKIDGDIDTALKLSDIFICIKDDDSGSKDKKESKAKKDSKAKK